VKSDSHSNGDYLLRRHGEVANGSQFDPLWQSADNSGRPPSTDQSGDNHSQPLLAMPAHMPPCPRCQDDLFVRREQVLSGRRVSSAYYCGRCNHEWLVETTAAPDAADRRVTERRKRPRPSNT
jgi:hypothetical protein